MIDNFDFQKDYLKITNKNEIHGFQYKDGINLDTNNLDKNGSCTLGLYFTDKENIEKFYDYGIWIRMIKLPVDDPTLIVVQDTSGDKWRANKLILGDKLDMSDPETYTQLGLPMLSIDMASQRGYIDILEWWKTSGLTPASKYTHNAVYWESQNGDIEILEWWLHSGLELKYTEDAMDYASNFGKIDVLDWWKHSGLELMYTETALKWASFGRIVVLNWWKNSGLELK